MYQKSTSVHTVFTGSTDLIRPILYFFFYMIADKLNKLKNVPW